ncbi:MAG: hypothetical protein HY822_19310, partial [Acidobacteria bacterium]|nr:hypothetical protein [Acidobacteriota bacterium]
MRTASGHIHARRRRRGHAQDGGFDGFKDQNRLRTGLVLEPAQEDGVVAAVFSAQLERGFVTGMRAKSEMPMPRGRGRAMVAMHVLRVSMSVKMLKRRVAEHRKNSEAYLDDEGSEHLCALYEGSRGPRNRPASPPVCSFVER